MIVVQNEPRPGFRRGFSHFIERYESLGLAH